MSTDAGAADLEYASTCYFPTTWLEAPLVGKRPYSHDTSVYTFALPEGRSLDLPVCACLLARGYASGGEEAVRPYTPVSDNGMKGAFELMVKTYADGAVSKWLDSLVPGDPASKVGFKHIKFNIKAQYPFGKKRVTMLCGGTGVAPMYQALHKLVHTPGDETEVVVLCGNRSPSDILLKDELAAMESAAGGRLKVVHVVGDSPDQAPIEGWGGELGWVDKAKVERHAHAPSPDTLVMVCGLPALYAAMCGPRDQAGVAEGTVLAQLGYTDEMVVKF